MSQRFICPYCRVAVDPATMEAAQGENTEFHVCPYCDSPMLLFVRDMPPFETSDSRDTPLPLGFDIASSGLDQREPNEAAT